MDEPDGILEKSERDYRGRKRHPDGGIGTLVCYYSCSGRTCVVVFGMGSSPSGLAGGGSSTRSLPVNTPRPSSPTATQYGSSASTTATTPTCSTSTLSPASGSPTELERWANGLIRLVFEF